MWKEEKGKMSWKEHKEEHDDGEFSYKGDWVLDGRVKVDPTIL